MSKGNPPIWLEKFFTWFCHQNHLEGLEGDLYEMFDRRLEKKGLRVARMWYFLDLITLLRPTVIRSFRKNSKSSYMGLINNYFRTALRLSWKRKSFTAINLLGLTLGLTAVIFIGLYVQDELSFDQHIPNKENKYRVYNHLYRQSEYDGSFSIVPPIFAPSLEENFPQVTKAGRLMFDYGGTIFRVEEKVFSEKNGFFADPAALDILDVELIHGSMEGLEAPYSMLVSESTFNKFFPDQDFDNQTVQLSKRSVAVAGVYPDFPKQSHIRPDYLLSMEWLKSQTPEERMNSWIWQQFFTYVEVQPGTDMKLLTQEFQSYASEYSREDTEGYGFYYEPQFQSITDIHLHSSSFQWENANIGNYQSVLFLCIAAVIILIIACLNFINLSTVQAIKRAREVGVRKFVGATKPQLLLQYGIEAFLYCLTAAMIAALLVGLNIENFNVLSGKEFELKNVFSLSHVIVLAVGVLAISIFSGWYPALLITKIQPIRVLHGVSAVGFSIRNRSRKFDQKQLLVGGQYVLSIGLILISLIVNNQFSYLQNKDMGFRKDHLVSLRLTGSMYNDFKATRNAFVSHSAIENASLCYGVPGGIVAGDGAWFPRIQEHELSSSMIMADPHYISTMDIQLKAGRDFSPELTSDAAEAFIINETAARNLGFSDVEEALGEPVRWKMWTQEDTFKVGRVIGVVSDFNYKSLHHEVGNVIIHMDPNYSYLLVRMNAGQIQEGLTFLEEKYEEFSPTRPFEYEFVDQSFAKFYENEQRTSRLFSIFTILAIFTASIGLFGLVSYTVANKSKEISIRKVLGAGTQSIFTMLVRKYLMLTGICMVIALPVAYYISGLWLENFAYRTTIEPDLFLLVAVITLLVTLITVGFQAWQGAISNPTDKLRAE